MQIDKLVQLLESPVFIPIRLHLLDVNSPHHRNLLKSLYGLLMMLPQSQAYKTLSDRLTTVSTLKMHLSCYNTRNAASAGSKLVTVPSTDGGVSTQMIICDLPPSSVEYGPLLQHFEEIQQKHNSFKLQIFQQQAKVPAPAAATTTPGGSGSGGGSAMYRSVSPIESEPNIKSFSTSESM